MSHSGNFEPLAIVVLTEEERSECESLLRSLHPPDQQIAVPKEDADEFKRSFIALALIGRAERLSIVSRAGGTVTAQEAATTAVKACTIYPLSVYFFECARILEELGQSNDAEAMYREFIRRRGIERPTPVGETVLAQHDIGALLETARERCGAR
jgi:hypothetical protein